MTTPRARAALAAAFAAVLLTWIGCGQDATVGTAEGAPSGDSATAVAWFEEVARASGLNFEHRSGHDRRFLFPEIMGGGAALFDMDGDGDLDAYLVQSGSLHAPGSEAAANRLFANLGGGRFEDATDGSGAGDRGYGMGVAAGDYDNDGDVDLYVTNLGPNTLLRNDGSGRFVDTTHEAGVGDPSWGTSAAFVDYDIDGDLDLFVANYVEWSPGIEQDCYHPSGLLDYCLPTMYKAPAQDRLFRNDGDGTFSDVTFELGLDAAFGNGLGVVCGDFDDDGTVDIFVANDTMMNQLWMRDGGLLRDDAMLRGCALDQHGMAKAGMGTTAEDVDNDGDLDLIVVNMKGQTDSFFRNEGGYFVDQTGAVGLGGVSRGFTRFGLGLADFDNDGVLDLYQANGGVVRAMEPEDSDPFAEANLLFRGERPGRFVEVLPRGGTSSLHLMTSRAAAFGDVDDDGGIDVLVVNRDGPAHLFRNVVPDRGRWVRFAVLDEHGRDALGARVTICVEEVRLAREVRAAFSYCASNDPRAHFGLDTRDRAEKVAVEWPDGAIEWFGDREADATYSLSRGSGTAAASLPTCAGPRTGS